MYVSMYITNNIYIYICMYVLHYINFITIYHSDISQYITMTFDNEYIT